MLLRIVREDFTPERTIGRLYVDGAEECFVLEDAVREVPGVSVGEWKVPGRTAIPYGTYQVIINVSARFRRRLPLLLGVPGFDGIRIHPGNTHEDTEGCPLVGKVRTINSVLRSREAFGDLFDKIEAAEALGEGIICEVARQ